jgi:Predicted transcriptional regulator
VRHSISAVGTRIIRLLIGQPPKKMSELIEATGVTRTAVSEQLNELIASGYVRQNLERLSGRGRPRYLYSATESALKNLFDNYQSILVPATWRAIKKHCSGDVVAEVCDDISTELADYYNQRIHSSRPVDRLQEFTELVCHHGHLGNCRTENGQLEYDMLSCPFASMYDESGIVCEIDRAMLSKIVKSPMERICCRLEGAPCCVFRMTPDTKDEENADVCTSAETQILD